MKSRHFGNKISLLLIFFQLLPLFLPVLNNSNNDFKQKHRQCVEFYVNKQLNLLNEGVYDKDEIVERYTKIFDRECISIAKMATNKYLHANIIIISIFIVLPISLLSRKIIRDFPGKLVVLKLLGVIILLVINIFGFSVVWNFGLRGIEPPGILKISGFEALKGEKFIFEGR